MHPLTIQRPPADEPPWGRQKDFGYTPAQAEAILQKYYARGEQLVKIALVVHFFIAIVLGFFYHTWLITLPVATAALAMFFLSALLLPNTFFTRCMAGVALQVYVAIHIYQLHGLPELHFYFFTACTVMIVYCDWKAMWPGTILIIGQLIVFAVLENSGVNLYFFPDHYVGFTKLFFHFTIAIGQVGICGYWAYYFRQTILRDALQREALARSEERTRLIVDTALDAVITMDYAGKITGWNPQAEAIFGWRQGEVLGKLLAELIIPVRYRQAHRRGMEHFLATGQGPILNRRLELAGLRRNGEEFPVELTVTPNKLDGRHDFSAFVRDITERKRARQELDRFAQRLKRSNDELEKFAYVASHDLKEPLRMVASYTQLLADNYQGTLDADADKCIQYAVDGAHRMQTLIDNLLDYSRVGMLDEPVEPVDLTDVVEQVLGDLQISIRESAVRIEVERMPVVMGERTHLTQLFLNLLSNAIKYRGEHGPFIRISWSQKGEWCDVTVADNGIGIDPQFHDKIFGLFQRLHTIQEYPGTGIGLSVCKKIVEQFGGRIWIESALGRGAAFHFTLPCSSHTIVTEEEIAEPYLTA
jgi:PAS domain S-box-containing protein